MNTISLILEHLTLTGTIAQCTAALAALKPLVDPSAPAPDIALAADGRSGAPGPAPEAKPARPRAVKPSPAPASNTHAPRGEFPAAVKTILVDAQKPLTSAELSRLIAE